MSKEQVLNYFDFDDDKQVQKRFDKVESSIERLSTSVKSKFVSIDNKIIKILEDNYKKSTARKKSISVMQSVINVFSNDREGLRDELQKEKILNIKLQKTTKISLFIAVVALMLSLLIAAILFLK